MNLVHTSHLRPIRSSLAKTPIIDVRGFDEQGIHYIWRSFALRARLDAAGGHSNHVLWRFPGSLVPTGPPNTLTVDSLVTMDKWLTALKADTSGASLEARVVSAKPAEGFDFCYLSFDKQFTLKVTDKAICDLDAEAVVVMDMVDRSLIELDQFSRPDERR